MADRVSVLHVVDCLNTGGTERQLFELVRRLDRRRFRPLVACFKARGDLLPRLRELGIEPFECKLPPSLMHPGTALQVARLALFCRLERVRVVHAHDFYSNLIGIAAAQLAGARAIASRRDLGHWLRPIQKRALRLACARADFVIANAVAVGDLVTRIEGVEHDKVRVVPNGIDVDIFDASARDEPEPPLPPLPEGAVRGVVVASMHLPDKGQGDLLNAAAILQTHGRRVQWLLVGDGALQPQHEENARALGLSEVHFLGRRTDVPRVLARADLVVHPSWAEGFPNVVLEAMCAGRPVVATRVGGCPELVNDETGILVEPRQPEALADAIDALLGDPEQARALGAAARRFVESRYSLDRMSATMTALYDRLLAPSAPSQKVA
jgi:glycosyltransferase involved in cell wall biosynthesis